MRAPSIARLTARVGPGAPIVERHLRRAFRIISQICPCAKPARHPRPSAIISLPHFRSLVYFVVVPLVRTFFSTSRAPLNAKPLALCTSFAPLLRLLLTRLQPVVVFFSIFFSCETAGRRRRGGNVVYGSNESLALLGNLETN